MKIRFNIRGVALALAGSWAMLAFVPAGASAETYDWIFEPEEIAQISLGLSPESRAALDADPDEYVPAQFEINGTGGQTFGPAAAELRLKGNSSFRTLEGKAAFKLKFPKASRPWGLKKLTLNSMVQDPSKVRETLAYETFRAMGVPASRTGYSEVDVNGVDYGLYLSLETLDDQSLERWFESTQHLYEGPYTSDLTHNLISMFEIDEGEKDDITDLEALVEAADSPLSSWETISPLVDAGEMVRMWATEAYVGHWDGYTGNLNNYYVHSDENGIFSMLPSGTDQTFLVGFAPEFFYDDPRYGPQSRLSTRCLEAPACRESYAAALDQVRDMMDETGAAARSADLYELLRPHIVDDPRKEHSIEASDLSFAQIEPFLEGRSADLDERLGRTPQAPAGLKASPVPGGLDVDWAESVTLGAEPVTGYRLEYRPEGESEFTAVETEGPDATAAKLARLRGGIRYSVRVRALSHAGPGAVAELAQPVAAGMLPGPPPDPDPPEDSVHPRLLGVRHLSREGRLHRLRVKVKLEKPALRLHLSSAKARPTANVRSTRPHRLVDHDVRVRRSKRPRWAMVSDAAGNVSAWKRIK